MAESFAKKEFLAYALLAMPLSFAGIPLYIYAPDFYATEYGASLTSLGFILLMLRFFDALQDPLIGYYGDKFSKYRPVFMPLAAVTLVVGFSCLFRPLVGNYMVWFAVFIIITTTSFSILTINLNSLGGMWSKDGHQKTTIASYREAFGLLGLSLAVILPSTLQNYMSKEQSFFYVGLLLAVIMMPSLFLLNQWQVKYHGVNTAKPTTKFVFKELLNFSARIKTFFIIYAIAILASSIPAVLILFFIRDRLGLEEYTGLFLLVYFVSGVLGIVIWNKLSQNVGKNQTWLIAMMMAVASFIWVYFLQEGNFWQYIAICSISGIAFGAELVLPTSILADYIHKDKKENNVTLYYGILAFLMKFSLAISAAIVFPYLSYSGFEAGKENTDHALKTLSICYAVIPCAIKIISICLIWRVVNEENNRNINRSNDYAGRLFK